VLLVGLVAAGAPARLTADAAAGLLRLVRPRTLAERTRRALARDLVAEVRRLDRRTAELDTMIGKAVATTASTLPELARECHRNENQRSACVLTLWACRVGR
jgi:hypothetical protein